MYLLNLSDIKIEKTPSEIKLFYNLKSGIVQDESKQIISLIKKNTKSTMYISKPIYQNFS